MTGLTRALYVAIAALYLLHNDFWLAADSRILLGLPIGLTYHVGFCLGVAFLMWMLVRFAWPEGLDSSPDS